MKLVSVVRFAYTPVGTFGRITVDKKIIGFSVERPWLDNKTNVSCIPTGYYELLRIPSAIVKRTSSGKYISGYMVKNVCNRTSILFHIANTMDDLKGCIGMGDSLGMLSGKWAVLNSSKTFEKFMQELQPDDEAQLIITDTKEHLSI